MILVKLFYRDHSKCAFNLCSTDLRFIHSFTYFKPRKLKKISHDIKLKPLTDINIEMTLFDRQSHVKNVIYEDGVSNL